MTHPPMTGARGNDGATEPESDAELESLLGALEDADCRAIIEATNAKPLSASELSEACDLPLSTTYRKLDQLTEVGVLEEQLRISKSGQHKSEYTLRIEQISLTVDGDGISLAVSQDQPTQAGHSAVAGAD
jgi:DNA-binding transcriptional ArsR family regulator